MRTNGRGLPGRAKATNHRRVGSIILTTALVVFVVCGVVWVTILNGENEEPEVRLGVGSQVTPNGSPAALGKNGTGSTLRTSVPITNGEVPSFPFVAVPAANHAASAVTSFNEELVDANGDKIVVTHAVADGVEMLFPLIALRDRREAPGGHNYEAWYSRYMPNDSFAMPMWASSTERNTLRHASIFISIAAFRDYECATTLESALTNAASPHRIYAGISEERKPLDDSCLSKLKLDVPGFHKESGGSGDGGRTARRLLYGQDASASIVVRTRTLRWADILVDPETKQPNNVSITATRAAYGTPGDNSANRTVPLGIYIENSFMEYDVITCVYSDLEMERDRLTLDPAVASADIRNTRRRVGRLGGPQERPSDALRGCRVTSRLTPERSARGPTFGRYVTSLLFFHQDYYMVVDSHSRFPIDWDLKMIARVFQMKTRGVLSHYPNGYTPTEPLNEYKQKHTMSMCRADILSNGMPKLGAKWVSMTDFPLIDAFAAAGYMFGDAQYALDTPFDPFLPYLFDGEEILYSARLWTAGWDLYAPAQANVFHHYGRKNTPKFWSLIGHNEAQQRRLAEQRALFLLKRSWPWVEILARRGLNLSNAVNVTYVPVESRRVVTDTEADAEAGIGVERVYYGMGTERTLEQYWIHTELTDEFVNSKDNENRWRGGNGLCDAQPS